MCRDFTTLRSVKPVLYDLLRAIQAESFYRVASTVRLDRKTMKQPAEMPAVSVFRNIGATMWVTDRLPIRAELQELYAVPGSGICIPCGRFLIWANDVVSIDKFLMPTDVRGRDTDGYWLDACNVKAWQPLPTKPTHSTGSEPPLTYEDCVRLYMWHVYGEKDSHGSGLPLALRRRLAGAFNNARSCQSTSDARRVIRPLLAGIPGNNTGLLSRLTLAVREATPRPNEHS